MIHLIQERENPLWRECMHTQQEKKTLLPHSQWQICIKCSTERSIWRCLLWVQTWFPICTLHCTTIRIHYWSSESKLRNQHRMYLFLIFSLCNSISTVFILSFCFLQGNMYPMTRRSRCTDATFTHPVRRETSSEKCSSSGPPGIIIEIHI